MRTQRTRRRILDESLRLFNEHGEEGVTTADIAADTRRMNEYIERKVLEMPEQYLWMHKRFKTRPPGESSFYPKD